MHMFPIDSTVSTRRLSACFNHTSSTYKFYWFLSLLDAVERQQKEVDKKQLFIGMISNAWYTVNYFNVSFGQQDLIQKTLKAIKDLEHIAIDEPTATILQKLLKSRNNETRRLLMHFDKQVPHRFLSPWYVRKNKREVYELSQAEIESPIYKLYNDKIVIPPAWYNYLQKHIRILRDYVYWNLSLFLQVRNPNVPDIPNKIIKPAARNPLHKQRKFWDHVMEQRGPLRCIYTGKKLTKDLYHVEHFVPYSFVSHDQVWNLIPSDVNFNMIKSNKLPPLKEYFEPFYKMQSLALDVYLKESRKEKLLEDYLHITANIENGLSKQKFFSVINPLVTIAANNGFEFLK